jgi:hypothetical protein
MMIFNKARMAKLSGILTESKKGIKDSMADQFGGGKEEGDPWLDGEVTTEGTEEDESSMMNELDDEDMKEGDEEELDEASLRRMIRSALSEAKKEMMDKKKAKAKGKAKGKFPAKAKGKDDEDEDEEKAVREAVRSEIKSVLRSRGVTLGGTGPGFKR